MHSLEKHKTENLKRFVLVDKRLNENLFYEKLMKTGCSKIFSVKNAMQFKGY